MPPSNSSRTKTNKMVPEPSHVPRSYPALCSLQYEESLGTRLPYIPVEWIFLTRHTPCTASFPGSPTLECEYVYACTTSMFMFWNGESLGMMLLQPSNSSCTKTNKTVPEPSQFPHPAQLSVACSMGRAWERG